MDSLIDSVSRTWNLKVIRNLVDWQDVKIIESIPLSRNQMMDKDGWHFTKKMGDIQLNQNIRWNGFIQIRNHHLYCMDPQSMH